MKQKNSFQSVSVILPVINETVSLTQTIETIERDCASSVSQYLIVICGKTTAESLTLCKAYAERQPSRFVVHHQKLPFLGGAIREAFELATGSHLLMMASDLETNPDDVKHLIAAAQKSSGSIITASRWLKGGKFEGYNHLKWLLNYIFQNFFSLIYGVRLTDMTFGFRIFPTKLVRSIHWEELRHPFLFETLIKPIRLGVEVIEIPSSWKARIEGESQNTFFRNFSYFKIGLKVRFCSKESLLNKTRDEIILLSDHGPRTSDQ